ncbi:transglutaminase family protein [Patulibacter defluvii]|uniref:transglutaminase family protein n=1 Tax=Patulibacter defluvii TaxID=3095358 RepID=UPI002A760121|nr:transglutaminase family protein [Patulibacter sp. DM4]
MHFAIDYVTEYRYDGEVVDNLNAIRARPATTSLQRCDEFHVRTDPETRLHRYVDYFGTEVVEFGIDRPHDHLTIDVRARVTTSEPDPPPEAPWDAIRAPAYDVAGGEFVLPAADDPPPERLAPLLDLTRATSPLATVRLATELLRDRFAYDPTATFVGTTTAEFLDRGAGVCQDFAQLAVRLLRGHGIAARYVSGYLWARDPDGGEDSIEVATHAWIEALLPGLGGRDEPVWVGSDPTNGVLAGPTHVKIGHGRGYQDVPPIRGVYRGQARAEPSARVTMTRLDPQISPRA